MHRIRILIIILFFTHCSFGQANADSTRISLGYPVYSQYLHNGLVINPAYTGTRNALSAFLSYRMQWMGIEGAPSIQSLSLHSPMKNDKVALGLKAQFMQYGVTKSTSIYASYAYHIRLKNGKISFGINAGADMSNTDYTGILETLDDPSDPVFMANDKPYMLPNAGAGVYYFNDKLFAGLSIPSFLSYRRSDDGSAPKAYNSFSDYEVLFTAGGLITFSPVFKFKPSVLVDYSMQKAKKLTQLDLSGNFIIADLLWVGGSWRTTEQVAVGILQVQLNPQLMFGFSYDYSVGRMTSFKTKGSSEFVLRYEFGSKVSAANPRYF
jgi:type IX secretion system PorP/SprF family membrane protein